MRVFVIFFCITMTAAAPSASAQVVHLKNGEDIHADRVQENASTIQYELGDDTYTIPKSVVQSVEVGTRPPSQTRQMEIAALTPEEPAANETDLLERIIHDHGIDRGAVAAVEAQGNAKNTAVAYYVVAKAEFQAGKFVDARHDFETALRYDSQNPTILNYYAALLVRTGNPLDAIPYAQQAAQIAPDSADAFAVLGYAQFAADRLRDAAASWKKSLVLRPDASIERLLARAGRESAAETNYSQRETGHFVLRYEGKESSEAFRNQLLATLESAYRDLAAALGGEPRSSVQVVLYTNQAFFDVTRAPAWTGALNDGKLRIPLQGLDSVTPELTRILRHELTHSFVNQLAMGRCPQWLNEGIAQMLEPRGLGSRVGRLAQLFAAEREIPLNTLESGFFSFNGIEAALAYDESLAAAEYLRDHYGMTDLQILLKRMGQGESNEATLRAVLHCDYGRLEDDIRAYLVGQSGN